MFFWETVGLELCLKGWGGGVAGTPLDGVMHSFALLALTAPGRAQPFKDFH